MYYPPLPPSGKWTTSNLPRRPGISKTKPVPIASILTKARKGAEKEINIMDVRELVLNEISEAGFAGVTNMQIAENLRARYQAIQRTTNALNKEGLIVGRVNQWGLMSNISWRIAQ
jgi:hypothetical protein